MRSDNPTYLAQLELILSDNAQLERSVRPIASSKQLRSPLDVDSSQADWFDLALALGYGLQRKLPSMPTKSRPSALDRLWWQDMQLEGASWK